MSKKNSPRMARQRTRMAQEASQASMPTFRLSPDGPSEPVTLEGLIIPSQIKHIHIINGLSIQVNAWLKGDGHLYLAIDYASKRKKRKAIRRNKKPLR
jgi:hypothetical protein